MIRKISAWLGLRRSDHKDPLEALLSSQNIDPSLVSVAVAGKLTEDLLAERRSTRQWAWIRRSGMAALFVIGLFFYVAASTQRLGWAQMPKDELVGVVKIQGGIGSGELASSDQIIPALQQAFEAPNVKAIILSIDSGGGAPVEAERINTYIEQQAKLHPKPVVAVINNLGASAAFMIAMNTDKIYAARFSAVGSIGAVLTAWDLSRIANRLDVHQRVYASGPLKTMLSPFLPPTEAADAKAQEMVNLMGRRFLADLQAKRGKRLDPHTDFGTGEVWDGETAIKLGLVDEIGTIETVSAQLAPKAKLWDFGPNPHTGGFLGRLSWDSAITTLGNAIADRFIEASIPAQQQGSAPFRAE